MATDIGELVTMHARRDRTKTKSFRKEPQIKLKRLESKFLREAARPYYRGGYSTHVPEVLHITPHEYRKLVKSISDKFGVSDDNALFPDLCIALEKGLLSIEEILGHKNMERELPRLKVALRNLTKTQKRIIAGMYNYAVENHGFSYGEVAETMQYDRDSFISTLYGTKGGGKNGSPTHYEILGISNLSQLAFFAHIYMQFMHNPVEEQLNEQPLDKLEATVIKMKIRRTYDIDNGATLNETVGSDLGHRTLTAFNAQSSMEVVLKALDLGFYTLLLEVDIPAFVSLDSSEIDLLREIPNSVGLTTYYQNVKNIYQKLGIHTQTQLAPYIFLATKLDENEMDLLRSANASPDQDPMQTIFDKFNMPEHSALLAPSKYLATKREMAAKNS